MSAIMLEGLTKRYRTTYGLHKVNLTIEEGETFGIIGKTGAGKTTLVRLLINLIAPTSGKASVFGMDVVRQNAKVKSMIGYVPSKVQYYDFMRGRDIFRMVSSMRKEPHPEQINDYCEMFRLDPKMKFCDMPVNARKKTAIIQAMLGEPRLLILDEPLLALDEKESSVLIDLLREKNKNGVTILFCSQSFEEAQSVCQRTAFLQNGVILREHKFNGSFAGAHRIKVKAEENISAALGLLHAKDVVISEGYLSFFTDAEIDGVIKALSHFEIQDLKIESPTTEDAYRYLEEKSPETEEETAYV